jgi:hypothetical protein
MTKKFDPAPLDKHAADPNEAAKADRDMQAKLKSGLLRQQMSCPVEGVV